MLNELEIEKQWGEFKGNILSYITSPRKEKLLKFYEDMGEILLLAPASSNESYHSSFPGGYLFHVNKVVRCILELDKLWDNMGTIKKHTLEETIFSAINHDLGKLGDVKNKEPLYIVNDNDWERKNRLKTYKPNIKIPYSTVPDHSLFLLQQAGIETSFNEMLAIRLHDGLYDKANENYLITWYPETKPRSSLVHIMHQADMMASRIEFEHWFYRNEIIHSSDVVKTFKTKDELKNTMLSKTIMTPQLQEILKNL